MKKHGFSIIEVVIIVAILGILLTLGVIGTSSLLVNGRDEERKTDAQTIATYFETFYSSGITTTDSAVAVTNMITNPSFEAGLTDVGGSSATVVRSTNWAADGQYSISITPNSSSTSDSFAPIGGGNGAMRMGMQAGKTYTIQAIINIPSPLTGTLDAASRTACVVVYWKTADYAMDKSCANPAQAGIYHLSLSFSLPAGSTEAFVRLYNGARLNGGTVYYDSVMLVEGNRSLPYLDGNSPHWTWSGTTNASTSSGAPIPAGLVISSYPNISVASPGYLETYLRGVDLKSFTAPGASEYAESFVAAKNNVQTEAGVLPQPTVSQYVYQPIDNDGELCTNDKCRSFNIFYRLESDGAVHKITSRHQ